MPNANLRQSSPFSCGAAALLCAAKELGVQKLPGQPQDLKCNMNCERQLYKLTASTDAQGQPVQFVDFDKLGYSYPHEVAKTAQKLGLDVTIYSSGIVASILTWQYPTVTGLCRDAGFMIYQNEPPALAGNQRMIKIVSTWGLGLHYVMKRPDGTYMDPGDGQDFGNYAAMNSLGKLYKATGISLVLERSATPAT